MATPEAFRGAPAVSASEVPPWDAWFDEPDLRALLSEALGRGFDVTLAGQRVARAEAQVRRATGSRLPTVSAGAGGGFRRFGRYTMDGAGNASTEIVPGRLVPVTYPELELGVAASWEISAWGRLKNLQAATRAAHLASVEGRALVATAVVGEVATTWYELVALDLRQGALEASVSRQTRAVELVRAQKDVGRATELSVQQLEASLASVRAEVAATTQQITEVEGRLSILTGRLQGRVARSPDALRRPLAELPTGLPSEVLRRRPDVREAEARVAAAGFDVAAARAAFYPSLSLTAGAGLAAFEPRYLLSPESVATTLAGGLIGPLINRSALRAEFQEATVDQVEAAVSYHQLLVEVVVEVETELSGYERSAVVLDERERQRAAAQRAAEVSEALFAAGKATYVDVLLAQESVREAELGAVDAALEQRRRAIGLYRALGGGVVR
jgi:NodT family efflux transporter outer membrane factor (OMF) lipoprotein